MLCPGRSNLLSPVFYRTLLEQGFAGRSPSFASRSGVLSPPARARVLRLKCESFVLGTVGGSGRIRNLLSDSTRPDRKISQGYDLDRSPACRACTHCLQWRRAITCIWGDLWIDFIHVGIPQMATNNRPSRFTSLGLFSLYAFLVIDASVY